MQLSVAGQGEVTPARLKLAVHHHRAVRRAQPGRTVLRPFVPADNPFAADDAHRSRLSAVVARVLALSSTQAEQELAAVEQRLSLRHRDVAAFLDRRFHDAVPPSSPQIEPVRRRLVGAYLSEEYSFEATAIFNPSVVTHPDQSGLAADETRFLMSLRAVGEGHVSSIVFGSGIIGTNGSIRLDPPSQLAVSPRIEHLPGMSTEDPGLRLCFAEPAELGELVIFPVTLPRSRGLEDLRLTPFVDEDGKLIHFGTYTAVGPTGIRQELLRTDDFRTFELHALTGAYAATKGMSLFPRRLGGYYAMLGRQDHENVWLLRSSDLYRWDCGGTIIRPQFPWEIVQIGNCGAPLAIAEGWLVLMHGVGPVRNYCIGACLLDASDPAKILARTTNPILTPRSRARNGYVPNVVYSCGGLVHGRRLLLPYGIADSMTAFASLSIDDLLAAMD